ncbi:MAG: hypothetical protein EXR27_19580 [Betaproteobacteria bacterium]|nr:hypothetical protein [Betaproteobacteria bacterium]
MSENLELLGKKLEQLVRMRAYPDYSTRKMQGPLEKIHSKGLDALTPEEHETIAAFRARLADFQEHLGTTMRSVAIEEEVNVDRFGSVLAFMEKMRIVDDPEVWKAIRELRNDVHHKYEHDPEILFQFFNSLAKHVPVLLGIHDKLKAFVARTYGSSTSTG